MTVNKFELNGLATAIGSMPHIDPHEACSLILTCLPDIPAWPQLPKRSFLENMYVQYSEGFPGIEIENEHIWIDRSRDLSMPLEELYTAYLENNVEFGTVDFEYAAGFHTFLAVAGKNKEKAIKGQVTGPISFGLAITDQNRRPLIYDDVLADALAKHLRLKATWQEKELKAVMNNTIISVDEPYLSSLGSAFISLPREQVVTLLEETLGGISGLKAIHCCGNTDWSVLLQTSLDILSFDAYNYGEALSLYPSEVKNFLSRGGIIAWGIVPNSKQALAGENEESILSRLDDAMKLLSKKGVSHDLLNSQCLITPSCALESLSIDEAKRALELTAKVSTNFRNKYGV